MASLNVRKLLCLPALVVLTSCTLFDSDDNNDGDTAQNTSESSSSSSITSQKPGGDYRLGGFVTGLNSGSQVVIRNGMDGSERAIITQNTGEVPVVFWQKVPSGESLNVEIELQPKGQLCQLSGDPRFVVKDSFSIRVNCANVVKRNIEFERPIGLALNQLSLSSNYEEIQAGQMSSNSNLIEVYDNSFVVLYAQSGNEGREPIYIAHVNDIGQYQDSESIPTLTLDAKSTLESLMLLEPAISAAIMERSIAPYTQSGSNSVNEVLQVLFDELKAVPEYQDAIDAISRLIGNGGTLLSGNGDFDRKLQLLLIEAVNTLTSNERLKFNINALPNRARETVQNTFLNIDLKPLGEAGNEGLDVSLENLSRRHVVINSTYLDQILLKGGEEKLYTVDEELTGDDNMEFEISGPGVLGEMVPTEQRNVFKGALVSSVLHEHYFRSLSLYLGLKDPLSFSVSSCLSESSLNELSEAIESIVQLGEHQEMIDYRDVIASIYDEARSRIISGFDGNESLVNEIFGCDKFGPGAFFQNKRSIAESNVKNLIDISNQLFSDQKLRVDINSAKDLTLLMAAIERTESYVTWRYSKALSLTLFTDRPNPTIDQEVAFQANCWESSENQASIPCYIKWSFGDGFSTQEVLYDSGQSNVQHSFSDYGDYTVSVDARRENGVRQSIETQVSVDPLAPQIQVVTGQGQGLNIDNGSIAYNFENVDLGTQANFDFRVRNIGNADLILDDITSASDSFQVSPPPPITIGPESQNNSRTFRITFAPTSPGEHSTKITLFNNDPDTEEQLYSFRLQGMGTGDASHSTEAEGAWKTSVNGQTTESPISRYSARQNSSQDGEGFYGLRFWASEDPSNPWPQVFFKLPIEATLIGAGDSESFELADLETSVVGDCRGLVAMSSDWGDWYCTYTSGENQSDYTGTVTITAADDGSKWIVEFEFDAVLFAFACDTLSDRSSCGTAQVLNGRAVIPAP